MKTHADLLERFKDNNLGLRCASFKISTKEGIINPIRMNFHRENQLCFEVLKGVKVEDKVEYEGEKGTIKQVFQKEEANKRRIFVGMKKLQGIVKVLHC